MRRTYRVVRDWTELPPPRRAPVDRKSCHFRRVTLPALIAAAVDRLAWIDALAVSHPMPRLKAERRRVVGDLAFFVVLRDHPDQLQALFPDELEVVA